MALANTRSSSGNPLFGGQVSGDAYVMSDDGNAVYRGGASAGTIGLGDGLSVQRGLTGPEFLGFTRNGQQTDLLATVKLLADGLGGADPAAAARETGGALDDGLNAVATGQTLVGARLAWIDFTSAAAEQRGELRSSETEQRGGADLATSITQMQQLMVVLQASQTSFVRLASLSLFNALG
jgi:flagellar hook-associated protein 3 FlgL